MALSPLQGTWLWGPIPYQMALTHRLGLDPKTLRLQDHCSNTEPSRLHYGWKMHDTNTFNSSNLSLSWTGLSAPVGECDAGYYCPPGQSVPNPTDYPCSIGLHCPVGSALPVPCTPGTYTNLTQAPECLECPAGFYCVPEEVIEGEW